MFPLSKLILIKSDLMLVTRAHGRTPCAHRNGHLNTDAEKLSRSLSQTLAYSVLSSSFEL